MQSYSKIALVITLHLLWRKSSLKISLVVFWTIWSNKNFPSNHIIKQFDEYFWELFAEEEFSVKSHHHAIWRIFFRQFCFTEEEFSVKSYHHAIWRIFSLFCLTKTNFPWNHTFIHFEGFFSLFNAFRLYLLFLALSRSRRLFSV